MDHSTKGRFKGRFLFLVLMKLILILTGCQRLPESRWDGIQMHWISRGWTDQYYLVCNENGKIVGEVDEFENTWTARLTTFEYYQAFDTEDDAGNGLIAYAYKKQLCSQ
jgi:hypothetical protein